MATSVLTWCFPRFEQEIGLETSQGSLWSELSHSSKKALDPHQAWTTCPYGSKLNRTRIPDTSKFSFILGTADEEENIMICVRYLLIQRCNWQPEAIRYRNVWVSIETNLDTPPPVTKLSEQPTTPSTRWVCKHHCLAWMLVTESRALLYHAISIIDFNMLNYQQSV